MVTPRTGNPRGRPPRLPREFATALATACIEAIMEHEYGFRASVDVVFPANFRVPRGFPPGKVIDRSNGNITRTILAGKLLNWLHDNGYTKVNTMTLLSVQRSLNAQIGGLWMSRNNLIDKCQDDEYTVENKLE